MDKIYEYKSLTITIELELNETHNDLTELNEESKKGWIVENTYIIDLKGKLKMTFLLKKENKKKHSQVVVSKLTQKKAPAI